MRWRLIFTPKRGRMHVTCLQWEWFYLLHNPTDCQSRSYLHEQSVTSFFCLRCFIIHYMYIPSVLLLIRTSLVSIQKDSLWVKLLERRFLCSIVTKFLMHLRFLSIPKTSNILLWPVAFFPSIVKKKNPCKLRFVHLDYNRSQADCKIIIYDI